MPRSKLPTAAWLGQKSADVAVMRSGWGADDAFVWVSCGDYFGAHGHDEAGAFQVFRHAILSGSDGTYDAFDSVHWDDYYSQHSVHANTIAVYQPGEFFPDVADAQRAAQRERRRAAAAAAPEGRHGVSGSHAGRLHEEQDELLVLRDRDARCLRARDLSRLRRVRRDASVRQPDGHDRRQHGEGRPGQPAVRLPAAGPPRRVRPRRFARPELREAVHPARHQGAHDRGKHRDHRERDGQARVADAPAG